MACEEGQHERRLIVGIEVGPVHGDLDALTRSDDGRHPQHKQFLDINSRVREQPIDLLDGMLAYTSLRQSEPVADGAHGQGCTGHHTNGGVCQRLNPLCMQAFAEQSIDKPVCMLKLGRPHANNHWYLPRRVPGRLLYCQPVFNPLRPLMPIFPINRRAPILFGKIFCLFDSFITQDPPKMRGCLSIWVQFFPCLALPLLFLLFPPKYTGTSYWIIAGALYALAKAL